MSKRAPLLDPAFATRSRKRAKPNPPTPTRIATGATSVAEVWSATSRRKPTLQVIHHLADYDSPRIRRALRGSFRPTARGRVGGPSAQGSRTAPLAAVVDDSLFQEAALEHSNFQIDMPLPKQRKRKVHTPLHI